MLCLLSFINNLNLRKIEAKGAKKAPSCAIKSKMALFIALIFSLNGFSQTYLKMGSWRTHLPYNDVNQIVEVGNSFYIVAEKGMYRHNTETGGIKFFSKVDGLSETQVQRIGYSEDSKTLIVAYKNTNIDLIKEDKIINIPGILRRRIVGLKQVNDIFIKGTDAYLSCSFGIVVIDLKRGIVKDSYERLNPENGGNLEILAATFWKDTLFAATPIGIIKAVGNNLKDFASWRFHYESVSSVNLIRNYENSLYYTEGGVLWKETENSREILENRNESSYHSLEVFHNKLATCHDSFITIRNAQEVLVEYQEFVKKYVLIDRKEQLWTGGVLTGLVKIDPQGRYSFLKPTGPNYHTSYQMEAVDDQIWVTSGGKNAQRSPTFNRNGIYRFVNGEWINFKRRENSDLDVIHDFTQIAVSDNNRNVWLTTHGAGLVHFSDGNFNKWHNETNSIIQKSAGFLPYLTGISFDQKGDLWFCNYWTSNPLKVIRANGQWEEFSIGSDELGVMVVDPFNTKWIASNKSSEGIIVVRETENGTLETRALRTGRGSGGLPSVTVTAMAVDKSNSIWIGTTEGLAVVYNPSLVFQGGNNADAQQIIVSDELDTGYLLGSQIINDIKIDGANRKWIATNNGAWLVAADGRSVVRHFTADNSPLLSNIVNCIAINPKSGEVFFGTEEGIISTQGDATEADQIHSNEVVVFPNPVYPEYSGPITIRGLPQDATVKITDAAGRVVYEMIATGGTAVWNGESFLGNTPKSGVYLIFTSNKVDEDALVSKVLFVR